MTDDAKFTWTARLRSFRHAGRGLRLLMASQHNAWVHGAVTLAVLTASATLGISRIEWCAIALAIAAVWTAEALNTALESLGDVAASEFDPLVARAKDVAAGGVLISAAGAAVVGLLVLGPRLLAALA